MQNIEYFSTIGKQMDDIFTASCNLLKRLNTYVELSDTQRLFTEGKKYKKNKDEHSRNTLVQGKYAVGTNVL